MVAQYNFKKSLHDQRTAIKTAFHWLILECGSRNDNGSVSLDTDQFDIPIRMISCHRVIRNNAEIFFEDYSDGDTKLVPLEAYGVEALADFYDRLAKAINTKK